MEEARANQARRLARLQAQQQPQPEPQAEPVRPPPGLADMPDEAIRNIVRLAASSPRATQYWHIPMMRDLARLAPINRSFRDQARGMSNLFPVRRAVLGLHTNPRAMAAIERAQNTRIRRPHLVDDAGDPWMPVRHGIQFGPNERLVDRRGRDIDRGRD